MKKEFCFIGELSDTQLSAFAVFAPEEGDQLPSDEVHEILTSTIRLLTGETRPNLGCELHHSGTYTLWRKAIITHRLGKFILELCYMNLCNQDNMLRKFDDCKEHHQRAQTDAQNVTAHIEGLLSSIAS